MDHITRFLIVGGLALSIAGCGGDEETATNGTSVDPSKSMPLKTNKVVVTPKAIGNRDNAKPTAISARSNKQPQEDALPPGILPEDVFVTAATQNTFEVSATSEELATFSIVAKPVAGAGANTFEKPVIRSELSGNAGNEFATPERISVQTGDSTQKIEGLPEGFVAVTGSRTNERGLPNRIRNTADKSEFVLIPAGSTIRGSQEGPLNTRPEHQVYLEDYYISVHEVTLGQYELFRKAEKENDRLRQAAHPLNEGEDPEMPALGIPQLEARKYAEWLGCDLPTEAQWEKAARGPEGYLYPWGNGRPIWSTPRDKKQILPVKSWRNDVSTYGVYDLAGNAREWTLDVYRDNTYGFDAGEQGDKLVQNPTGPKPGAGAFDRVIRGGGDDWKVWNREGARFSEKIPDVGFRLVVNTKPPTEEKTEEPARTTRPRR